MKKTAIMVQTKPRVIYVDSAADLRRWLEQGWRPQSFDGQDVVGQCLNCGRLLFDQEKPLFYCGATLEDESECWEEEDFPFVMVGGPVDDARHVSALDDIRLPIYGGGRVPLFNPRLEDVPSIEVFAHASACSGRWTGHASLISRPVIYTIAQHSCVASSKVRRELMLPMLMHDAAEVILHDFNRRLREFFEHYFPAYEGAHRRWDKLIAETFEFDVALLGCEELRGVDDRMGATEARDLGLKHAGVGVAAFDDVFIGDVSQEKKWSGSQRMTGVCESPASVSTSLRPRTMPPAWSCHPPPVVINCSI